MSDPRQWFRVRPSYQKPAGGFLAIGARDHGERVESGTAVRFVHHGDRPGVVVVTSPDPERQPRYAAPPPAPCRARPAD